MILVSSPAPFRSSTVRDTAQGHPSRSTVALCSQKRHQSTAKVRHQPIVASAPSSEPSRVTPHASSRHPSGFSVADILDSAKQNGSSGSREKNDDREPASAAVAAIVVAGHCCLHLNLVRRMLTENQRRLLRLLVTRVFFIRSHSYFWG